MTVLLMDKIKFVRRQLFWPVDRYLGEVSIVRERIATDRSNSLGISG